MSPNVDMTNAYFYFFKFIYSVCTKPLFIITQQTKTANWCHIDERRYHTTSTFNNFMWCLLTSTWQTHTFYFFKFVYSVCTKLLFIITQQTKTVNWCHIDERRYHTTCAFNNFMWCLLTSTWQTHTFISLNSSIPFAQNYYSLFIITQQTKTVKWCHIDERRYHTTRAFNNFTWCLLMSTWQTHTFISLNSSIPFAQNYYSKNATN